jgi:hypothetical protein
MRISKQYNASLLRCIAEEKSITISDLKKKYLPPEQPGIIQGVTVMFDSDLITLREEGYITIENDIVIYIHS